MSDIENSPEKIKIASLNYECYKRIKEDILIGKLPWGDRLDVIKLANDYGISRSPVVKAIDRLAMELLVNVIPNKGSYVVTPTEEDITEITEIRIMLESTTCVNAYKKNKDLVISRLEENEKSIKDNHSKNSPMDFEDFLIYDRSFHTIIAECANNGRLLKFYKAIRSQAELFRTHTFYGNHPVTALQCHTNIILALKNDDPEKAVFHMQDHIKDVHKDALESLQSSLGE